MKPSASDLAPGATATGLALPYALGLALAAAAAMLVAVEMAQPPLQPGFPGISLSNAGNSRGARAGLELFRDHLDWLPYPFSGLILSPEQYIYGLRIAVIAMACAQALALVAILRSRTVASPWPWLAGPVLASIALLAYPPINTDVFSYASFGWAANQGGNPYLAAPSTLRHDPFATMNDWAHITTPYGPLWTGLSRLLVALTDEQPFGTAILFKIVAALASMGLAIATLHLARRVTGNANHAVVAMVIVAWSPILLAESAGTAHNDALMMALAMTGLLTVTTERPGMARTGLLVLTAAVLVKPVAVPLLALAMMIRLVKRNGGAVRTLKRWVIDCLAIVAFAGLAFAPYWGRGHLPSAIAAMQRKLYFDRALHVNPLWVWALPRIAGRIRLSGLNAHLSAVSRAVVVLLVLTAIVAALTPFIRRPRISDVRSSFLRSQILAWGAVTAGLGLAPINAHAWYSLWALGPIAIIWTLAAQTSRARWLLPCLAWLLLSFLVYHTWPAIGVKVS